MSTLHHFWMGLENEDTPTSRIPSIFRIGGLKEVAVLGSLVVSCCCFCHSAYMHGCLWRRLAISATKADQALIVEVYSNRYLKFKVSEWGIFGITKIFTLVY